MSPPKRQARTQSAQSLVQSLVKFCTVEELVKALGRIP